MKFFKSKFMRIMRLTIVIITIALMQVSAAGLAQKVSLSFKNVPLEQVLVAVKQQTAYNFVYTEDVIAKAKRVTIQLKDVDLKDALQVCFQNQPLNFTIEQNTIVVKEKESSLIDKIIDYFSAIDVRGKVLDEEGLPLQGATVKVKGSNLGVMTDKEGNFFLKGVPEDAIIVIAYLGYKPLELKAVANMGLIKLEQNPEQLQEVVINKGYYETTRELNTGSVSKVDAKTIARQPVLNPLAAIAGRMTGVVVQQNTGIPGGDFKIEIRGKNNLRDEGNEPLYIIDGVPFSSEKVSSSYNTTGLYTGPNVSSGSIGTSPLNGINNADIESIEILKDADATAIYGSRGANGVVLITTKKGKIGKTKLSLDVYRGAGKTTMLKMLNTEEYLSMRRQAFANDGISTYPAADYDINGTWDQSRYTDWQKVYLGGIAGSSSVQASLSGGSEGTQFLFSAGYRNEDTVFPGPGDFRKLSAHLSLNHHSPNKKLTLGLSITGNADKNTQPSETYLSPARGAAPDAPALYDANGNLNWENSTWLNPLSHLVTSYNSNVNTFISNAILGYEIIPGLQLKSSFGFTQVQSKETSLYPSTQYDPAFNFTSKNSSVTASSGINESWIIEPQINYEKEIGPGQFAVLIGTTFQEQKLNKYTDIHSNFPSNSLLNDFPTAAHHLSQDFTKKAYRYSAFFGRLNYTLDQKYIVNLTGRRDGSSRFGPGRQFGNFAAIGAAWIFSKAKWIENNMPFLSFGKLRASYGTTGNDQIGNNEYLDTYTAGTPYAGTTGLNPTRLFNPDFSWEINKKMEAAIDLSFFRDRINLSIGYYRNRCSNQLITYTLPLTTGFNGIRSNFPALIQNKGLELELNTTNVQYNSFRWTSSLNLSIPKNTLLAFPGIAASTYANSYIIGQSVYIKKFYEVTGVDPNTGIYTFRDYNADGKVTNPDDNRKALLIGQKFYGGFENSFTYKSWSLDVFLQFVKQTGYNYKYAEAIGYPGVFANQPRIIMNENRWQKPGDVSDVQRFATQYNAEAIRASFIFQESDRTISDASFIRCKNVSLAYQFPSKWTKLFTCRAYIQAQNLFVITNYLGYDPESQRSTLPPLKMLAAGIQLTL